MKINKLVLLTTLTFYCGLLISSSQFNKSFDKSEQFYLAQSNLEDDSYYKSRENLLLKAKTRKI